MPLAVMAAAHGTEHPQMRGGAGRASGQPAPASGHNKDKGTHKKQGLLAPKNIQTAFALELGLLRLKFEGAAPGAPAPVRSAWWPGVQPMPRFRYWEPIWPPGPPTPFARRMC
jgi:hypothetical protein